MKYSQNMSSQALNLMSEEMMSPLNILFIYLAFGCVTGTLCDGYGVNK